MLPNHVNPSGGPITTCDDDEACEVVACGVCLVEIPASVAHTYEGPDYVQHFCGLDCLEKWHQQAKNKAK